MLARIEAQLRTHRASHQSWVDHLTHPGHGACEQCRGEMFAWAIGGLEHQRQAIRDYDWMLDGLARLREALGAA